MKSKHTLIKVLAVALIATSLCLLSSCPDPINRATATQARDLIAPVIVITSPAEGCLCANIVEITGKVTDAATESGNDGRAASLTYEVSGSTVAGQVLFSSDGTFVFQISTVTLGTNFTLAISAVDWNGNTAQVQLPLRKQSGSGIPSFAVSPGNQQATLTWEPVPHTVSYTLYYTTNGSLPSEQVGQQVLNATSPCVLSGLTDGNLHVFQLKAVPESGWPESISDYVKTIPLSPQTLAPRVTGGVRQIRVEWDPIPATEEYEVWRSTEQAGTYYNLSGTIRSASFVDTGVTSSQWYWYKVRPTLSGSANSFANGAQTDPFCLDHPIIVGSCPTSDANSVAVSGDGLYAYVADGSWDGLRVIDISNPTSPAIIGTYATNAFRVAVSGNYACLIAEYSTSLQVINISSPSSPILAGTCSGLSDPQGVAVSGNYAYVADSTAGMRVINITTNPPSIVANYSILGINAAAVALSGNYAYLVDSSVGLRVINITDPLFPTLAGTCNPTMTGARAVGVSSDGNYAYVEDNVGFRVINCITRTSPVIQGTPCYVSGEDITVSGSYAYVADRLAGLRVIDISVAGSPTLRVTCATSWAQGVAVSGSYAYVADDNRGLRVIDVSSPAAPTIAGSCVTAKAQRVAVSGTHAFVANWNGDHGLQVIDLSTNPPTPTGHCFAVSADGVAVSGSYAYVADSVGALLVVDISNPDIEVLPLVGSCDAVKASAVAVSGSYAYAASGALGLQVVDISNPALPVLKGTCATTLAKGVAVSGSYAYVADDTAGLRVIDISDPATPTVVGTYDTNEALGVAVSGNYAYVADYSGGLRVIDITNPALPSLKGTYGPALWYAYEVAVSGSYAYVASKANVTNHMQVIDISNPASPSLRGTTAAMAVTPTGVAVSGAYAYVSDGASGLHVIDLLP